MDQIAAYWWVWLGGVLIALGLAAIRSIANSIAMVKDAVTIFGKLRIALRAPAGQRRRQVADVGLEVACEKIKSRAIDHVIVGALLVVGGAFGVLLILAIIQHAIVYWRAPT